MAWPLSISDKGHFDRLRSTYKTRHVECEVALNVEHLEGWFFSYHRAQSPASEQDLMSLPADLERFKFLSYQAQSMHAVLYDFIQSTCASWGKPGLHLPAVVVAAEFRRWINRLGVLEHADEATSAEIKKRVQLIDDLQLCCDQDMSEHLRLLQALGAVRLTLQSIQQKWGFYQAQESIQENLKAAWQDIAQALRSLLVYLFYVLRSGSPGFSFDPATFAEGDPQGLEHERGTLSGRLMRQLLLDPYVAAVVGQEDGEPSSERESFPRLDCDEGRRALERALRTPHRLCEGALEEADSGCVLRTDCGVGERFQAATNLFLGLHTRAAALARCARLLQSAYKLSALGGEQLLALLAADKAGASLISSVFCFSRRELDATAKDGDGLHSLLLQGHLAMKASASSWFSQSGFEQWSRLFSFASGYRENFCAYAHKACQCLDRLSERFVQLSSMETQRQLDAEAQHFQTCALATLRYYGEVSTAKPNPVFALEDWKTGPEQLARECLEEGAKSPFHSSNSGLNRHVKMADAGEKPTWLQHQQLMPMPAEVRCWHASAAYAACDGVPDFELGSGDVITLSPTATSMRGWDK